jgi:hypothetical protein
MAVSPTHNLVKRCPYTAARLSRDCNTCGLVAGQSLKYFIASGDEG